MMGMWYDNSILLMKDLDQQKVPDVPFKDQTATHMHMEIMATIHELQSSEKPSKTTCHDTIIRHNFHGFSTNRGAKTTCQKSKPQCSWAHWSIPQEWTTFCNERAQFSSDRVWAPEQDRLLSLCHQLWMVSASEKIMSLDSAPARRAVTRHWTHTES